MAPYARNGPAFLLDLTIVSMSQGHARAPVHGEVGLARGGPSAPAWERHALRDVGGVEGQQQAAMAQAQVIGQRQEQAGARARLEDGVKRDLRASMRARSRKR